MGQPKMRMMNVMVVLGVMAGVVEAQPAGAQAPMSAAQRKRIECGAMEKDERWGALKKCAIELRAARGASGDDIALSVELRQRAELEHKAKAQLEQFISAQVIGDMRVMRAVAKSIHPSSRYADTVRAKWDAERSRYILTNTDEAEKAASEGRCRDMRQAVSAVRVYDATIAGALSKLTCAEVLVSCSDPTKSAETERIFDEIQQARISNHRLTTKLVGLALDNRCLEYRRPVLLRIGILAACQEKRRERVDYFFEKGNKDPSLIAACPEYLKEKKRQGRGAGSDANGNLMNPFH